MLFLSFFFAFSTVTLSCKTFPYKAERKFNNLNPKGEAQTDQRCWGFCQQYNTSGDHNNNIRLEREEKRETEIQIGIAIGIISANK